MQHHPQGRARPYGFEGGVQRRKQVSRREYLARSRAGRPCRAIEGRTPRHGKIPGSLEGTGKVIAIKWLSRQAIDIIHSEQLAEHGGLPGIKDENALEAALGRHLHKHAYGEEDHYRLAAASPYGFSRNHPFISEERRVGK